jgi:hypothetical protein
MSAAKTITVYKSRSQFTVNKRDRLLYPAFNVCIRDLIDPDASFLPGHYDRIWADFGPEFDLQPINLDKCANVFGV